MINLNNKSKVLKFNNNNNKKIKLKYLQLKTRKKCRNKLNYIY